MPIHRFKSSPAIFQMEMELLGKIFIEHAWWDKLGFLQIVCVHAHAQILYNQFIKIGMTGKESTVLLTKTSHPTRGCSHRLLRCDLSHQNWNDRKECTVLLTKTSHPARGCSHRLLRCDLSYRRHGRSVERYPIHIPVIFNFDSCLCIFINHQCMSITFKNGFNLELQLRNTSSSSGFY
jgi:hypothetical protein